MLQPPYLVSSDRPVNGMVPGRRQENPRSYCRPVTNLTKESTAIILIYGLSIICPSYGVLGGV